MDKIQLIQRQTNYTTEEAEEQLLKCDGDVEKVIRIYLQIPEKKHIIQSVNQEIYSQIRNHLGINDTIIKK